jgi:hypothetical protein
MYLGTDVGNATLIGTTALAGASINLAASSVASLVIGNQGGLTRGFNGWMEDFRIYQYAGDSNFVDNVRQFVAVPPAPTGLSATAGNAQVSLNWNASPGSMSYNVKYSTTNGGPFFTVANVIATSYIHAGLTNCGTYYYVVSAVNAVGESSNSSQVSATVPAVLRVEPEITNGQITLLFQGMSGGSYTIETSTNLANWMPLFTNLLTNDQFIFTDTNATNPARFYRVKQ